MAALPFRNINQIVQTVLVVPRGYEQLVSLALHNFGFWENTKVIIGGARRQDSVQAGVRALDPNIDKVIIHDGARVFLTHQLVENLLTELSAHPVVFAALPVTSALHQISGSDAIPGPDRSILVAAQTPQGFDRKMLEEAFRSIKDQRIDFTDEVALVYSKLGIPARIVAGESDNIKITTPEDLDFFMPQLKSRASEVIRRREL
jgi:2-C-methyl-D-erythritol 4-phosphate cytidylyltransferase